MFVTIEQVRSVLAAVCVFATFQKRFGYAFIQTLPVSLKFSIFNALRTSITTHHPLSTDRLITRLHCKILSKDDSKDYHRKTQSSFDVPLTPVSSRKSPFSTCLLNPTSSQTQPLAKTQKTFIKEAGL